MEQGAVPELQEEEGEEMSPVIPVAMKDLNQGEGADSEEENDSSITSARLRGQRGRPGPMGP